MNNRPLCILLSYWLVLPLIGAAEVKKARSGVTTELGEPKEVAVTLYEGLKAKNLFELAGAKKTLSYTEPAFGFVRVPTKYSRNALPLDRSSPFALEAKLEKSLDPGRYQFRLRAKGSAQLRVTQGAQTITLQTKPQRPNKSSHDALPPPPYQDPYLPELKTASVPHQEVELQFFSDGTPIQFQLIGIIGGKGLVPDPAELSVSVAPMGETPILLSSVAKIPLTDASWRAYRADRQASHEYHDDKRRVVESAKVTLAWAQYHESVRQWAKESLPPIDIPALDASESSSSPIDAFIRSKLIQNALHPTPKISDLKFLRRVALDLTGRLPTESEIEDFLNHSETERREAIIETYLSLPDWADHWVSYWQDVLAENPGILKPDLNNSGPFRWWLQQSFEDNLPIDRFVAELIQMKGSRHQGAPAAFAMATLNDAPMAAKADILVQAFQAEKLSCARCHDAPEHRHKQLDTFSLAAMLKGETLKLPKSSTVPIVEGFRKPRVETSLEPGQPIHPAWPFETLSSKHFLMGLIPLEADVPKTRNDVARHMVSPTNDRFAEVIVNRVWKRYLGAGIVEPAEDWEYQEPSHPGLLKYFSRQFMLSGYDLKQLARLILNSETYQSQTVTEDLVLMQAEKRHFAGPNQKRLSAEQLVDSLFLLAGKPMATEELNLNPLGDRPLSQFLNLGVPKRAWEFAALMNERDRPSLALPSAQAVVDVLTVYGWRQSRMNPITDREDDPSPLQTLILANGVVGSQISRLTDDNAFTELAIKSPSIGELIDSTIKRVLTRPASSKEQDLAGMLLQPHFEDRIVQGAETSVHPTRTQDRRVSWANHFDSKSNSIRLEEERQLRLGGKATKRLTQSFREAYEDFIWSLINSSEFITIP